jgi:hypothetical protein
VTLTLGPLGSDNQLRCSSSKPVCVECNSTNQVCVTNPGKCPAVTVAKQKILVRKHTPIQPKGLAFQTLSPQYVYSNNKTITCHWNVLETP